MKIGSLKKSVLEELFYGENAHELPSGNYPDDKDNDEITVYFGSRLWELLKAALAKDVE